jgi:hypothetical protein
VKLDYFPKNLNSLQQHKILSTTFLCDFLFHLFLWKIYFVFVCASVHLTQYCAGNKIEKNEMGWECDTYGCGEGGVYGLGGETGGKETTGET